MDTIAIVGLGRFGKTLARLLSPEFKLIGIDPDVKRVKNVTIVTSIKSLYSHNPKAVFFAVPIGKFKRVLLKHLPYVPEDTTIFDVLSVKMHPYEVLRQAIKKYPRKVILNHPMFGPDSSRHGFDELPWVIHNLSAPSDEFKFWKRTLESLGLKVIELTPKQHDKMAAFSQGVVHFLGRSLAKFGLKPTPIDTMGAKKLYELTVQTTNDTMELFLDLQRYNPYTKAMRIKLMQAIEKIHNKVLSTKANPPYTTIGIQGGPGSFNEIAATKFIKAKKINKPKIKYLYTTANVLKALNYGEIDIGIFAAFNSHGGMVWESVEALSRFKAKIIDQFGIPIHHHLMKLKDVKTSELKAIMAHPQVFKQCKNSLKQKYPHLKQITGKGELIDTAKAAHALVKGKLPKTTAILGPIALSQLYNLTVVESNLEDMKDNITYFLAVKRG